MKYFILLPHAQDIGSPIDTIQWMAVLKSVSAYEMFRKRLSHVDPANVIQFLLRDEDFPRSVHYCLRCVRLFLDNIAADARRPEPMEAMDRVDALRNELESTPAEDIILRGVHQYIDRLQVSLNELHNEIHGA
ncbi:MAG: alpha-E domain-containing protein, partial [Candidatus Competibacteraceae bacterium]|nr:alpha-E domain-containing protein [Candidatus Competibacteraceae bacterium]